MPPLHRPHVSEMSHEEHHQRYLAYRMAYLPHQIAATKRKLQMLRNEARRYGMTDLLDAERLK